MGSEFSLVYFLHEAEFKVGFKFKVAEKYIKVGNATHNSTSFLVLYKEMK